MISDPGLTSWMVNIVTAGIVALVGFLAQRAFSKVETTLESLGSKIDSLGANVARADGDRRVTDANLQALAVRVDRLEREIRDLSEGVAR